MDRDCEQHEHNSYAENENERKLGIDYRGLGRHAAMDHEDDIDHEVGVNAIFFFQFYFESSTIKSNLLIK